MKFTRVLRHLAAMLTVVVLVSCAIDQNPTAPQPPQANAALVGDLLDGTSDALKQVVGGLLTCEPMQYDSDARWIGPDGGTLEMGPHSLVIPKNALRTRVFITAEALRDTVNSVRFSPEGLQFAKSATLVMSYRNCSLTGGLLTAKRIAYTTEGLSILSYIPSTDNVLNRTVTGRLDHFSRYATAW